MSNSDQKPTKTPTPATTPKPQEAQATKEIISPRRQSQAPSKTTSSPSGNTNTGGARRGPGGGQRSGGPGGNRGGGPGGRRPGGPGGRRPGGRGGRNFRQNTEFEERVVDIARVTNVVKGGRRFSFSALVVIGNKKGKVAYGHGKAKEVPEAIKKAIKDARRNLIIVPITDGRTIPHIAQSKFVASKVLVKPAPKGRGIIASGAVRAVVELAGYQDIVTKSIGSSNKANAVKATLKALGQLRTVKAIAELRGKDVAELE